MNNKIILVTGASRGIGREIAYTLAKQGHTVIANYNKSEEKALSLKEQANKENLNIDIFKADVSKRNEVKEMINYILSKYKKIDVLINNAGIDQEKQFQDITDEDWNNVINVNLYSVFCVTQEVISNMLNNKTGCIINISSIYGIIGGSCASLYSASKAGIDGLTKSLAKELGPSNIRVNSIAPGYIDTDMNKHFSAETVDEIKNEIPLNKIGTPQSIAKCVNWLVNDDYTTGQVIVIDGGWSII